MLIRFAEPNDISAWRAVAADVGEIFGSPTMADDPEFIDYLERKIQNNEAFAAINEEIDEAVGFISFSRINNRISWLGVLEGYRNKGAGSKLLETALNELNHSAAITVETFRENNPSGQPARHLYSKFCFIESDNSSYDHLGNERCKMVIKPSHTL